MTWLAPRIAPFVAVAAILGGEVPSQRVSAQEADPRTAIEKSIQSYATAFNSRDAKGLAAHWSPEGVYISRIDGSSISGRADLEQEFAAQFEVNKDAKIEIATESIEFVSPNVALEEGAATVIRPDSEPSRSRYSVVHIKREGKWMIDRVSEEEELPPSPSHYEALSALNWMVGVWVDEAGGDIIRTECKWTKNENFLLRSFTVSSEEQIELSGMQFIGWDAAQEKIRSWVFDSDGGFAEGTWIQKGEQWIVKQLATMPDGRRASSTSILRPIDETSFAWQKIHRVVDGEILPNIDEVIIVRE